MVDKISKQQRSAVMAKVRSTGNRSTEGRVEAALISADVAGWKKHPKSVPGRPDFYFSKSKLAVFVDGCYWHACPKCCRMPTSNVEYWNSKIDANRRRDNRIRRQLRADGLHVMRIWEHEIKSASWLKRLCRMIKKFKSTGAVSATNP